jgi:hypothetical protein
MTAKMASHSVIVLLPFLFIFMWEALGLEGLTVPLIGILILLALIATRSKRHPQLTENQKLSSLQDELSMFTATTLVLLLIFSTGELTSPLFFLLYFIAFALSFTLTPSSVFSYCIGVLILFLPSAIEKESFDLILKTLSIMLITPLAYFFGKEIKERERDKEQTKDIAESIEREAENILTQNETNLTEQEQANLIDIMKKSEQLKS